MAESDRDIYRRDFAALEREREIMKDVPGWEVGFLFLYYPLVPWMVSANELSENAGPTARDCDTDRLIPFTILCDTHRLARSRTTRRDTRRARLLLSRSADRVGVQ